MNLPAAARKNADRAAELIKGAPGTPKGTPAAPAPQGSDNAAAELETVKREYTRLSEAHKVLQAKYNAEVPKLMSENAALKKRVDELEAEGKRKIEAGDVTSLNPEERALAGDELLRVIAKTSAEVAGTVVARELKPITDRVDHFQRQTEATYYATLDRECPGWQAQNDDPLFTAWLHNMDPGTNRLRNDLLQTAHAAFQGYRTAEIFNAFREKREIGARPNASASPDPDIGGGDQLPPNEPVKPTYTRAEIQQFYREVREGKWKGEREAARREKEADILAAGKEGRIR